mmetsp:Transcript_56980/g.150129  ORF Transcript_56980/g.150129 Transcript_56980/m.150129 type:complete len:252 (-) Transcript_56980:81-836(-)
MRPRSLRLIATFAVLFCIAGCAYAETPHSPPHEESHGSGSSANEKADDEPTVSQYVDETVQDIKKVVNSDAPVTEFQERTNEPSLRIPNLESSVQCVGIDRDEIPFPCFLDDYAYNSGACQNKFGPALKKLATGLGTGYVAGFAIKGLAISVIKATVFGVGGFFVAIFMGWFGKDQSAQLLQGIKDQAAKAEESARKAADFNRDGKVDLDDAKEIAWRVERSLLKNNLPFSLGAIAGAVAGAASATFNPFD